MITASNPRIGIILINLNAYEDTALCLQSLESLTYSNTELILVDNGSRDGSGAKLRAEFPSVTHIRSETNLGFTGGNNLGITHALDTGCEHVLLLNNDTIVTPGFLEPLLARLESEPRIAAVSGKIYYTKAAQNGRSDILWYAGSFRKWWMGFSHFGIDEADRGLYDKPMEVPYASGCEMLLRGTAVRRVGLLSDDYFAYWEESDWCERARKAGFIAFYEPASTIYHNYRSGDPGNESPIHNYLHCRNGFIFASVHEHGFGRLKFWLLFPLELIYRSLWDIRRKNIRAGWATLWGVYDFLRGYRGEQRLRERGLIQS
ncbi:MAG: glycosyltransferase family 2 protein [Bacteroidota bacterium]|nr:glycosyltransferase family 2 protein [Bacteroidota bacterium]MDP4233031.1 glycosyltransferase family 2 protein [Bacteroidota bacterium]MDP4241824.1 glycosyltransferase family 2 protein [Bacteroidota bacterium]MDP4288373.1 glycosyltransferase family 2 protein [Bacteroidota bacterium]